MGTDGADKIDEVANLIDELNTEVDELGEDERIHADPDVVRDLKKAVTDAGTAADALEDGLERDSE